MLQPSVILSRQNFHHNLELLLKASKAKNLIPVLKADAYGHGLLGVLEQLKLAQSLDLREQISMVSLARVEELKRIFLENKDTVCQFEYLILSFFSEKDLHWIVDSKLIDRVVLVINNKNSLELILSLKLPFRIHINLNTGMNRLGFLIEEFEVLKEKIKESPLLLQGLMTHFAEADNINNDFTQQQIQKFSQIKNTKLLRHVENSSALCRDDLELSIEAQRVGLLLFGLFPAESDRQSWLDKIGKDSDLKPVLQMRAPLNHVFKVKKGDSVGYGCDWVAQKETTLATVSLGYADGVPRHYDFKDGRLGFYVLNHLCPVVGRVSMDLTVIDLGEHPLLEELNNSNEFAYWIHEKQDANLIAQELKTINYDVLCSIGHRLPRLWQ